MGIFKKPQLKTGQKRDDLPEGQWIKCPECGEMIHHKDLAANYNVCPNCGHHFLIGARERIEMLADEGTFEETDANLVSQNPLNFTKYTDKTAVLREKTDLNDAVITGRLNICLLYTSDAADD